MYDHWRERFYPPELPKTRWFSHYCRHFSTVELNSSFYHLPSVKAFATWREKSPEGFAYAVKVSRFITHFKKLQDVDELLDTFLFRARILEDKLGPLLYQLPPSMHRNDAVLESFLRLLPRDLKHVVEFRSKSWFEDGAYHLLRKHNVGFCIYDLPGTTTPLVATADFAYVRFHGSTGLYDSCYTDSELQTWAKRISKIGKTLSAVYVYFNNDSHAFAVSNAERLREILTGK